jgi:hypothetical protein
MGAILVYGPSGSGKSRAIKNLPPQNTGIISSDMKPLPFKGWKSSYETVLVDGKKPDLLKSNYVETRKPASILAVMKTWEKRNDIHTIVWDTMTHVIINRFMTDPNVDWHFYKILAREIYEILDYTAKMKTDVIIIGHNDTKFDANTGKKVDAIRTIGKLLDEKVDIASLFTTVLTTNIERDSNGVSHYYFVTQSDGTSFAKSPEGMFELQIENDYNFILQKIHEYDE